MPDLGEMHTESWEPVLPEGWGEDSRQVESELFSQRLCGKDPRTPTLFLSCRLEILHDTHSEEVSSHAEFRPYRPPGAPANGRQQCGAAGRGRGARSS